MSCDSRRRRCCTQDLGEEYCGAKSKDHSEQTEYSGKRLCENSYGLTEVTQGSVPNARHFYVNKIPFMLTLSRKICCTVVNCPANRTVPKIFAAFKEIYQYYLHRGFCITAVHSGGEIAPLQALIASLPGGPMNNMESANKHVPEIEQKIRAVNKRFRAAQHGLPFQQIPNLLTIHIVFQTVKLLNFFPTKGGISDTLSPKTIMSGEILNLKKQLSLQIG